MAITHVQNSDVKTGTNQPDEVDVILDGVADGDEPVAGNTLVVFSTAYNNSGSGTIDADDVSSVPSETWAQIAQHSGGGDPFYVGIHVADDITGGDTTVTLNTDVSRYQAVVVAEFAGMPSASVTDDGVVDDNGTGNITITGPTPSSTDNVQLLIVSWYADGVDPSTAIEAQGWSPVGKWTNWNVVWVFAAYFKIQTTATPATVVAAGGLGGGTEWIASIASRSVASAPETWSDTADIVNTQTGTITSSYPPEVGGTFIITCDCWRPTDKGTDPTIGMISSNNGGSFILDHLLSTTEVDIANDNAHGLAHIRHVVESIATLPYTFPINLGEAGSYGQWTATYYPNIDNATNPVLYTGKDYLPHTGDDPDILPQEIPCTTTPINIQWSNVIISTTAANGGHQGVVDVNAPPGYISRHKQNENSTKYSGHTADKFLETPGIEDPVYDVDQPVSPEAGVGAYMRGSVVVYRTLTSELIETGTEYDEQITLGVQGTQASTVQNSVGAALTLGAGASSGPDGGNSIPRNIALAGTANTISSGLIAAIGSMSLAAQASAAYATLRNSVSAVALALQGGLAASKTQTVGGATTLQAIANVTPNPVQQALNVVALNANVNLTGGLALIRSLQLQLSGVAELSATGSVGSVVHDFLISLASVSNLQVDKVLVLNGAIAMQGQGNLSLSYQLQLAQTIAMSVRADIELTRQSIVGALLQLGIESQVAILAGRSFSALVELSVISTLEALEGAETGPALETLHFTLEVLRMYEFTQERFQ